MVTAEAVMAVVRAARPVFCCAHDGVAFAANAAFLADGYSLCAVGPAALINPRPAEEEEVGIDGWNSMNNIYAFLYCKEEEGKKKFILMKCVVIADFLAIDALDLEAQHEGPFIVQINVKDFYSEEQHKNYKDMYKNFVCLINILNTTLLVELGRKDTTAVQIPDVENSSSMNSSGNFTWENPSTRTTEPAGLIYPPVVLVGDDDTFPVPDVRLYPHSGGTGGSMHVGPNDPRFFPTNPSTPFGDLGYVQFSFIKYCIALFFCYKWNQIFHNRSVPPGGRYDPIGPPDAPGFEPSRFVSPSRHSGGSTHPDLEFFQQGPDFF
ncbi:putative proteasome inhibitor [Hordeum vulgare]|nr:putative proteasome inhibitor [Hordeum vulgare]